MHGVPVASALHLFCLGLCAVPPVLASELQRFVPQRYANKNIAHFTEADLLGSKLELYE